MRANFKVKKNPDSENPQQNEINDKKEVTEEEFEDFIVKAGAAGSFMVFRSSKKEDELGFDEL